ncbi:uncharacterized protein LOC129762841 [Toxorhynchites rutilus septentrionalis]|uniref:uncharacterized protein LOC129762841 n=1 Tax=Toxorhynchites rutilus septentrionalis TaxID=329112 RepID=UPI00247A3D2C|nr:uncharacterized protein LOC129762841 [Toxorhynchites rutilus septentrionalis]
MSFFTSFQELLDYDQSTNLNGFHFSNSLFGFDSNLLPPLESAPPPQSADHPCGVNSRPSAKTPSPIPDFAPLSQTPKQWQNPPQIQQHPQQTSPIPVGSKFQLKVTPNNEIYISNESGTFCELAGSFLPSSQTASLEPPEPPVKHREPPKTLFRIEKGIKRPLSPSDQRNSSGIYRSSPMHVLPLKRKLAPCVTNSSNNGTESVATAKLVVSNVINNGLIVNKKHLSNNDEQPAVPLAPTPERRIMRPKKRKKKVPPKVTLEARVEPLNGKIVAQVSAPELAMKSLTAAVCCKKPTQDSTVKKINAINNQLDSSKPLSTVSNVSATESALNFYGIKEKAAQEAIFVNRVESNKPSEQLPPPQTTSQLQEAEVHYKCVPGGEGNANGARVAQEESVSCPPPVEMKVVADLVTDKDVFGHISLLNNSQDRCKTVIYQNPVTSTNVLYSIVNPKTLNLTLGGVGRGTTATLTLQPHRGVRRPKKRGRKKKVIAENPALIDGTNPITPPGVNPTTDATKPVDPDVPVMVTRSGRLSKPPRYANNYFQNMQKQKTEHSPPPLPPPPPPPVPRVELPAPDPETAEKLPNFSAALSSTVNPATVPPEVETKRKMKVPLQYRCATCSKIYLGKRMQRHLQKYPSHNSERDCIGANQEKKGQEEKSVYLYKHLFDLLQKVTEKDKGRIMLKEISNFVDFVRALIPRLITNDETNSTVEYIDHNVADVLRLNHGKYRLKLSSLAEEYEKLNLTVNQLSNSSSSVVTHNGTTAAPVINISNGTTERQPFSFNTDDLLNQSSSFPSLTTLVNEHNLLVHPNTINAATTTTTTSNNNNNTNNNNSNINNNNINNNNILSTSHHYNSHHLQQHYNNHFSHNNHLPLIGSSCHDDAMNSLSGLCKSPVQHSASGMVNMALNLY